MKKLLVIALALCMMFALVACGSEEKTESKDDASKVESKAEESKAEESKTEESKVEESSAVEESKVEESSAAAEEISTVTTDEDTNYALNATYEVLKNGVAEDPTAVYLNYDTGSTDWADIDLVKMTDGKVAAGADLDQYGALVGTTVQYTGTGAQYDFIFTLDNYYADVAKIVFRNVRNGVANGNNRGFDTEIFPMVFVSTDNINWTPASGSLDAGVQVADAPEIGSKLDPEATNIENFDYTFTLDAAQTAKYVKIQISNGGTPAYVLQLDEIEIWN